MRHPHLTIRTDGSTEGYAVSVFRATVRGHVHTHHVAHSAETFTHRTDSPQGLPTVRGLDRALALGLLILRAQRRANRSEPEPIPGEECRACGQPMTYTAGPRRCPAASEMECR